MVTRETAGIAVWHKLTEIMKTVKKGVYGNVQFSPAMHQYGTVRCPDMVMHLINGGKNAVKIVGDGVIGPRHEVTLGQLTYTVLRQLHAHRHANSTHATHAHNTTTNTCSTAASIAAFSSCVTR